MPPISLIIFGIVLLLITVYIVVYLIYPGSNNNEVLDKMTPLNAKKVILMSDITQTKLLATSGSSVMGFFYLIDGDKTTKAKNDFKWLYSSIFKEIKNDLLIYSLSNLLILIVLNTKFDP